MSIRAVAKTIMPIYKIVNENNASNIKTSEDITYDVVEAFWVGFRNAYPMIFDQNTSSAYNALKAGPSEIMMKVLGKIYSLSVSGAIKDKMNQAKTFESILKPVLKNHSDITPNSVSVHGEKLFLVGKQGAMGKYSNNAAKNDAARLINREVFKHFKLPVT